MYKENKAKIKEWNFSVKSIRQEKYDKQTELEHEKLHLLFIRKQKKYYSFSFYFFFYFTL